MAKKNPDKVLGSIFKIWKTLKLGTGLQTADDFRNALKKIGCQTGNYANDLLGKPEFKAATKEIEVDLVILTTSELTGKREGGTTTEVFAGAERLGLDRCPPEVGPQLRLQYKDQPNGECLLIGMEPISDSGGYLEVFCVERDDSDRWLDSDCGNTEDFWFGSYQWVFLRRK